MSFYPVSQLLLLAFLTLPIPASAQVYCEPPAIDLNLGDAELRTDQNFTCAYNARICPIVFSDVNNNGTRETGELIFNGVDVDITNQSETTVIYQETTDNGENACFAPLTDGTTYRVRVLNPGGSNWPSPIMTSTGINVTYPNIQEFEIDTQSGTILAEFGFSPGGITFNVPTSVTFPAITTKNTAENTTTIVNPIVVEDTRGVITNWTVTGVVENFESTDTQSTIPVANKFTSEPGTISIINGSTNGITKGNNHTVTSTTNPFTVFSGSNNNGNGEYSISQSITLSVPEFTPAKSYESVITYTLIN
jgi:SdrD B-like domain/WxL domain surface cell wall-binding